MLLLILLNLFLYYCVLRLIREGFFFSHDAIPVARCGISSKNGIDCRWTRPTRCRCRLDSRCMTATIGARPRHTKATIACRITGIPQATHGDPGDSIRMAVQDKRKALQKLRLSNTFESPVSDDSPRGSTNSGGNLFQDNKV